MQINWLEIEHFRNIESLKIDFSRSKVTAFIGGNGQGKTSILEAIAFLALGKSFRGQKSLEALKYEAPHGRVKG